MSKEFYKYLVEKTVDFFQPKLVESGEKYILRFDKDEEVNLFYNEMQHFLDKNADIKCEYITSGDDEVYKTIGFKTQWGTNIFLVPQIDITDAYLTRLRNTIQNGYAMLIVCCKAIDSISGGTDDLQCEGMPFHREKLISDIRDNISKSNLALHEKIVLNFDLDRKKTNGETESFSIKDYEDIITSLEKGSIPAEMYRSYQLFCDYELTTITDSKVIKERIDYNNKRFIKIGESIKYGVPEKDLSKEYSDDFIKKVIGNSYINENWDQGITYTDVLKSKKKKDKTDQPIVITSIDVLFDNAILQENYFVRGESDKGAKQNKKHILIFNNNNYKNITISITFSAAVKKPDVFLACSDESKYSKDISGKTISVSNAHSGITINRIDYKPTDRKEKFQISYCIIDTSIDWFKSIRASFLVDASPKKKQPQSLIIGVNSDKVLLNEASSNINSITIKPGIEIDYDESVGYELKTDDSSFDDTGISNGTIKIGNGVLNVVFHEDTPLNSSCSGIKVEQKKLYKKTSFIYGGDDKLFFEGEEYRSREEFRRNLEIESFIVSNRSLACKIDGDVIIPVEIDVPDNVRIAYNSLIDYFIRNDTLPSLAYYNKELTKIAQDYVDCVVDVLKSFENNKPISLYQDVIMLGSVCFGQDYTIAFSPLHPLNVAYQIMLTKLSDDMTSEIREEVLKKICSDNLIPYIHSNNSALYKVVEQNHSPQWTYYCPVKSSKFKGSRSFVSTIVKEKIKDFCDHFKYLFGKTGHNTIIINVINMGDCYNVFKGIAEYYKAWISRNNYTAEALKIDVNIYNQHEVYNVFETLSDKSQLKGLLARIGIREDDDIPLSDNELINCILSNLSYYKKSKDDEQYKYCHLAFIEMDQKTEEGYSNHIDIRSGCMVNGLISGVTSMYYGESKSYRTGYGSKFNIADETENDVIMLANRMNAAMLVYGTSNPYNSQNAICTYINDEETSTIKKTYDSSNWVVFIDPKVDLNFFKKSDKDVMIIHYSDQHTSSSGYDAITVTKKTEQYEYVLSEFLLSKNVKVSDREQLRKMVNMFNAVNGNWLLKLISAKNTFTKEKISIQSAIKLALAFLKNENIIWIPIAMEEIFRVSGAVGLKQSEGLFTPKTLGYSSTQTSDDLLMFGVEVKNERVYVHLYPLEVKIGYQNSDEIPKAKKQLKQTRSILDSALSSGVNSDTLHRKFYRNFIAQLAVVSAEKLNLYEVWEGCDWEHITNDELRGKLLNDEFIISDDLRDTLGDGIIISFKEGAIIRETELDEVRIIKFLYSDGIDYILKSVDEIYKEVTQMPSIAPMMLNTYQTDENNEASENSASFENPCQVVSDSEHNCKIKDLDELSEDNNIGAELYEFPINENNAEEPSLKESKKSPDGMKILFGENINTGKPLFWYPNDTEKVMHPNTGIIGTMGTGKTQFTKSLILQLVREQDNNPGSDPLGILIFDYKGDYNRNKVDFVESTNAKVYDLFHLPFNPFSITVTDSSKPMLPMHIASTFRETISKAYSLGSKQLATLRDCIMQAYNRKGIDKSDKSTWTKTPPVMHDVVEEYRNSEAFKEDSLYSALSELDDFEIFEPDANKTMPLYDMINGVTVINLQGYDPSIQNLVVAITLDLFYSQMQANGHSIIDGKLRQMRKFILVDEADNFLKAGFDSIRKILKEGREFGVGTILSTQFLKHFDTQQDDFSKYILSWIVHKVDDLSVKDIKNLFNTESKSEEEELFAGIKKLAKHHSFVKLGDSTTPYYVKDRAFWELLEDERK